MRHLRRGLLAVFLVGLLSTALCSFLACSGGSHGGKKTGTISGTVEGTTVIAVDSSGDIVSEDDTTGKTPDANGHYAFTLSRIPVGVDVKVYLVEGGIYPMYFDSTGDGLPDTNVFSFTSPARVDLGFVTTDVAEEYSGIAIPETNPTDTSGVNAGTEDTSIPMSINEPDTSDLSLKKLLSNGFDALMDGWVLKANHYFKAAESLAGAATSNDADTARFLYALTRIAALGFDTYSDGNSTDMNTLGDILDRLGCVALDAARANFEAISCAEPLPDDAPTGQEMQDFLYNVVRPEIEGSIANLEAVSEAFNKTWAVPFDHTTVESDYGDVLVFKAAAEAILGQLLIQYAYDLDADIDETVNNDQQTIEAFLIENDAFGTLRDGFATYLDLAKAYAEDALDDLDAAIVWIQEETDPQGNDLINLADETPQDIEEARQSIVVAKQCLYDRCTVDDNDTTDPSDDVVLDASKFLAGIDLNTLFPPFTGDDVSGLFPKPFLEGTIVQGLDLNEDIDPEDGIPDVFQ
ncbi:MAG: hypothetical protein SWH78_15715 [Thermodesulfobacteriota bacterium]|nr:hypothetical protein [Thermodesulfobacteriota bacterium]